jgi:hypothetical protein
MSLTFLWHNIEGSVSFWLMVVLSIISMAISFFLSDKSKKRHFLYGFPSLLISYFCFHHLFVIYHSSNESVHLTRHLNGSPFLMEASFNLFFPLIISVFLLLFLSTFLCCLCIKVLLRLFGNFKKTA